MKHIINDLQKQREIERKKRVAEKLRDDKMIEYAQTRREYNKTMGNPTRAECNEWVEELVERLEEAELESDEKIEQVKEQDEHTQDNIEPDYTWRDGWFKR